MLGDDIHDSDDVEPRNNDSFSAALFLTRITAASSSTLTTSTTVMGQSRFPA